MSLPLSSDTICAISTAPGAGGVALLRISGSEAISIVDQIFVCQELRTLERAKERVAYFGRITHEGNFLDEVLVTCFRAPRSYTGEEVVEITCHGSTYIQQALLEALTDQGCRIAAPGEYTQRAYLNGKMDLSRAEAVADLIASESSAQHRMALTQMRGGYSEEFVSLRERLLKLTSLMELELDFSEEDVTFADRSELLSLLDEITGKIDRLTESFRLGNAIKKGIPVAIVGSTNAGKSTLLNALLQEERAIVSDLHGTTRDTVEETLNIDGLLFRFIDTAGLRATPDEIEALGIERSYKKIDEAALVLLLLDASRLDEPSQQEALHQVRAHLKDQSLIVLLNKVDLLGNKLSSAEAILRPLLPKQTLLLPIAAKDGEGLDRLRTELVEALSLPSYSSADLIVSNARHHALLKEAAQALALVRSGLQEGLPTDLVTPDLRSAIASLGEVTGTAITSDQVLHHIFQHFCIGK